MLPHFAPLCYLAATEKRSFAVKVKLTVRSVEAIVPGSKDVIVWDTELAGFGCKVTPKGKRSYFLYYRTKDGQQRRPSIGQHGPVRPEFAREVARRWLAEVALGQDPSQTRTATRTAPTMSDLCARYLDEHAATRKKATSIKNDKRLIDSHLLPALGTRKAAAITRADVAALHHKLRLTPYEANRMLALASKMLGLAERWGLRPDGSNPAKNIDRYKEEKRERYLTGVEVSRLWKLLHSEDALRCASPTAIAAIKLLILTGRRLNEVLKLEWGWLDLDNRVMSLPDTKTGALRIPLGLAAVELLRELKGTSAASRYVFPGRVADQPIINLQKPWGRLRAKADLNDVRLHDLRHTYASVGAGLGMSLPMIGKLLGHKEAATTARYAHLSQDPVKVAADAIDVELMRLACVREK